MRRLWVRALAPIGARTALPLTGGMAFGQARESPASPAALIAPRLGDPTMAEGQTLMRLDATLTRDDFDAGLDRVSDPGHGLRPHRRISNREVAVFVASGHRGSPSRSFILAPRRQLEGLLRSFRMANRAWRHTMGTPD